jgi:hypothetical protein
MLCQELNPVISLYTDGIEFSTVHYLYKYFSKLEVLLFFNLLVSELNYCCAGDWNLNESCIRRPLIVKHLMSGTRITQCDTQNTECQVLLLLFKSQSSALHTRHFSLVPKG